MIKAEFPEEDC
jgi:hypothetical protein